MRHLILCLSLLSLPALGQEALRLRAPLYDSPYNHAYGGARAPSMAQALALSADAYELVHYGIDQGAGWIVGEATWLREIIATPTALALDLLTLGAPLSATWLHEEWHRAALGRRGIDSKNGIYDGGDGQTVSVYGLDDAALIQLKRDHPAELTRLALAGDEALMALNAQLQEDAFFFGQHPRGEVAPMSTRRHMGLYTLNWLMHALYLSVIINGDLDAEIEKANAREDTEQARDFVGPDFTGWVHDLHHPDEPYEARGVHPSGVGVNRYIKYADLSTEEQDYLKKQQTLHLLNLLNPQIVGFDRFSLGKKLHFNAAIEHQLAPFGHSIAARLLVQHKKYRVKARLLTYNNQDHTFPGLEIALIERALSPKLRLSARLMGWGQPQAQRFDADEAAWSGLGELGLSYALYGGLRAAVYGGGKGAGWVMGDPDLDAHAWARLNLEWLIR
ncbi:hypothetical protein KKF91_19400 [Myxococcota bacterium]|nr:hypothetical protein [Myxococcota bacterium]MBU1432713.1 hypothetical protein [Myxococcota bacterium]MBU1899332.1 hypothetical protein [Myxococcota bacterium]